MPLKVDSIIASSIEAQTITQNGQSVGGGGVTDITYSELYSKTVNGELVAGSWYRLTDYKSVNFLNGWQTAYDNPTPTDPNFNPQEIYEGETEVLLLQAISSFEISPIGYSETFQGDIVQYEPFTNKIGLEFDIYNGQTLPDTNIVSGFDLQWDGTNVYFDMPTGYPALFGHYFYLYAEFNDGVDSYYQDGAFDPLTPNISICQYPYSFDGDVYTKAVSRVKVVNNGMKVILLDLVEADYNNYVADTLYVDTMYSLGDAYGWITKRIDTFRNITVPLDFRGRKYRRFEVNLTAINADLGTGYYGIGDNYLGQGTTGAYLDFKVFGNNGQEAKNIYWHDMGGPDIYGSRGYNDNNVFLGGCIDTKINFGFLENTLEDSGQNIIGDYFSENVIDFAFYNNTIGYYFYNNIIGNNFSYNTIIKEFLGNVIRDTFNNNTIKNTVNSIDFSSATHVYQSYNCEIFLRSDYTLQLSYIDGTNTIQYSAINA